MEERDEGGEEAHEGDEPGEPENRALQRRHHFAAAEEPVAAAQEGDCREEKADRLDCAHGAVDDDASATSEAVEEVLDGDMPLDRRRERKGRRDGDAARDADGCRTRSGA